MTYRVVFTARARADAVRQFRFLVERSPAAAGRWYTGLEKAISKLSRLLGITLRQMLYGRRPGVFRILFTIEGDTVTLHYIRHSAQGPIEP